MARKRKATGRRTELPSSAQTKFGIEENFNDSEDEFFAGRDKVLLDEGPATKRQRRIQEQEKDIQLSDEEVLRYTEDDDDFDEQETAEEEADKASDEEDDENWGTNKSDYYNADAIETEADAVDEEQEARRLQLRQLKTMTDADFGFDEMVWTQPAQEGVKSGPVIERLPEATVPMDASNEQILSILHSRYPEFEPLAKDLVELQDTWKSLRIRSKTSSSKAAIGITASTKLSALAAYLSAIAMYFAVVSSVIDVKADATKITAFPPNELREHAIIDNLMATRKLWNAVEGVEEVVVQESGSVTGLSEMAQATKELKQHKREQKINGHKPRNAVVREESPYSDELEDFDMPSIMQAKKSKPLDLQALIARTATSKHEELSDFGDEQPLTEEQAAEKAKRKKSLRFYTSQIAQKANKRGAASRDAGGDDDVPRKERLRDKQDRLLKEAEKRGHQQATAEEELGGDSEVEEQAVDGDAYYDSLVTNSKRKKADKQAKAQAYAEAARQGAQVYEEEQVGTDGKRRITYAIEKNKGLTPKRKKDVRNPRVKKRKKYDEKMKKLGSIRQVYKGGEGRGGYKGELTGIKTNVVKSVKL